MVTEGGFVDGPTLPVRLMGRSVDVLGVCLDSVAHPYGPCPTFGQGDLVTLVSQLGP